jgi:hypothetical protein
MFIAAGDIAATGEAREQLARFNILSHLKQLTLAGGKGEVLACPANRPQLKSHKASDTHRNERRSWGLFSPFSSFSSTLIDSGQDVISQPATLGSLSVWFFPLVI